MNNNNEIDRKKLMDAVFSGSGGKIDKKSLINAMQSQNADMLIKNLSDKDRAKLNSVLSDKESMEKLLNSKEAKAILKAFKHN